MLQELKKSTSQKNPRKWKHKDHEIFQGFPNRELEERRTVKTRRLSSEIKNSQQDWELQDTEIAQERNGDRSLNDSHPEVCCGRNIFPLSETRP